jgi:Fe-S cluster assembly iron-binding protein IscA
MKLTPSAEKRLKKLLPDNASGFSVTGYVGTCRGSTPNLQPANDPNPDQQTITGGGLTFFVNNDIAKQFSECEMDYDPSFLGKGLCATWPQCDGCTCSHG